MSMPTRIGHPDGVKVYCIDRSAVNRAHDVLHGRLLR